MLAAKKQYISSSDTAVHPAAGLLSLEILVMKITDELFAETLLSSTSEKLYDEINELSAVLLEQADLDDHTGLSPKELREALQLKLISIFSLNKVNYSISKYSLNSCNLKIRFYFFRSSIK